MKFRLLTFLLAPSAVGLTVLLVFVLVFSEVSIHHLESSVDSLLQRSFDSADVSRSVVVNASVLSLELIAADALRAVGDNTTQGLSTFYQAVRALMVMADHAITNAGLECRTQAELEICATVFDGGIRRAVPLVSPFSLVITKVASPDLVRVVADPRTPTTLVDVAPMRSRIDSPLLRAMYGVPNGMNIQYTNFRSDDIPNHPAFDATEFKDQGAPANWTMWLTGNFAYADNGSSVPGSECGDPGSSLAANCRIPIWTAVTYLDLFHANGSRVLSPGDFLQTPPSPMVGSGFLVSGTVYAGRHGQMYVVEQTISDFDDQFALVTKRAPPGAVVFGLSPAFGLIGSSEGASTTFRPPSPETPRVAVEDETLVGAASRLLYSRCDGVLSRLVEGALVQGRPPVTVNMTNESAIVVSAEVESGEVFAYVADSPVSDGYRIVVALRRESFLGTVDQMSQDALALSRSLRAEEEQAAEDDQRENAMSRIIRVVVSLVLAVLVVVFVGTATLSAVRPVIVVAGDLDFLANLETDRIESDRLRRYATTSAIMEVRLIAAALLTTSRRLALYATYLPASVRDAGPEMMFADDDAAPPLNAASGSLKDTTRLSMSSRSDSGVMYAAGEVRSFHSAAGSACSSKLTATTAPRVVLVPRAVSVMTVVFPPHLSPDEISAELVALEDAVHLYADGAGVHLPPVMTAPITPVVLFNATRAQTHHLDLAAQCALAVVQRNPLLRVVIDVTSVRVGVIPGRRMRHVGCVAAQPLTDTQTLVPFVRPGECWVTAAAADRFAGASLRPAYIINHRPVQRVVSVRKQNTEADEWMYELREAGAVENSDDEVRARAWMVAVAAIATTGASAVNREVIAAWAATDTTDAFARELMSAFAETKDGVALSAVCVETRTLLRGQVPVSPQGPGPSDQPSLTQSIEDASRLLSVVDV
eukprot:TRINITY_DN2964_c0_g1_i1.p1 TRINITY_DN2964_c0_g1~~TRINITY_DN2964_c0_g1_i1.p1  ORF type:complete len:971 (+),score=187.99 TRINITY_DN2964_c0_g1_i1:116-2914(+)